MKLAAINTIVSLPGSFPQHHQTETHGHRTSPSPGSFLRQPQMETPIPTLVAIGLSILSGGQQSTTIDTSIRMHAHSIHQELNTTTLRTTIELSIPMAAKPHYQTLTKTLIRYPALWTSTFQLHIPFRYIHSQTATTHHRCHLPEKGIFK